MSDLPVAASLPTPFATSQKLRHRLATAVLGQAGLNHAGLNAHLYDRLTSPDGATGGLVTEPAIEGAAPFAAGQSTLAELAGQLLAPQTVEALTGADDPEYRFTPTMRPYLHQIEAWKHLTAEDKRSILVTSGTGSGKTECFLVPLLDDLAREAAATKQKLSGVRAIMLYPLNALIASQQERLRAWSAPFKGRLRFGLYNGMTPSDLRASEHSAMARQHPEQVFDRKTLRSDPPPILVTNVTMLEYLTIRKEDRPLIDQSQGTLRWIIIDEAHSYVGSAAAEVALLLRRVLQTFGVAAANVRFVATSATIGDNSEAARLSLQRFLAGLAGVSESQVYVVQGRREDVLLPPASGSSRLASLAPSDLRSNRHVQDLVRHVERHAVSLQQAGAILKPTEQQAGDVLTALADDSEGDPILPVRVHNFMRAIPGMWSCLNPGCSGPKPEDWAFGAIALERTERCGHCQGLVYEVVGCRDCGEPLLQAFDDGQSLLPLATIPDEDEFAAASESEGAEEGEPDDENAGGLGQTHRRLIAIRDMPGLVQRQVDPKSGAIADDRTSGASFNVTPLHWGGECPRCNAVGKDDESGAIRPFRFGAPFLIGNATPVVLDGVAPMERKDGRLPADGRRLLSFTDSRQGTARFAANIESNAERSYIRGYVYNLVQKSQARDGAGDAALATLGSEIEGLKTLVSAHPFLANTLASKQADYDARVSGTSAGVKWPVVAEQLSLDPTVQHWIRDVWKDRDSRFSKSPARLADFLLLRELARRPRRANSLETMGLAQLRFPIIEALGPPSLPPALKRRNKTITEWQDFLYLLIDAPIRSYFALTVSHEDVRWLLPRGGMRRQIAGPHQDKGSQTDIAWPLARGGVAKSNPVIWLERALGLDASSGEGRAEINDILEAAWRALQPLFESVGSEYSLDLNRAVLAPIRNGWLCPVTRRVITHRLFGKSPYGHREASPFALVDPQPLEFPALPLQFARTDADRVAIADWLASDEKVAKLRQVGVWRDIHDRAAALEQYIRAEEHSAQQPPERLRDFERAFREGKINMLACSTTMEMGVDIGSVSAVMMTNVPPSIANYRQRVGRAGRRRQGFAASLTLSRDTPLDRETFRDPAAYLARQLRPPQVSLDAPRIVQRHVNALLLARWFSEASGELLKVKVGDFFGLLDDPKRAPPETSPAGEFLHWLAQPSVQAALAPSAAQLVAGTALADNAGLFAGTIEQFAQARAAFQAEWDALASEFQAATLEAARTSIALQLSRLCREHLLKELANRAVLPGHGFSTGVVPFINDSREKRDMEQQSGGTSRPGRYDYPTRNADVAIREYAPGAEVVIDGLVWQSAGVTLNWQRPAHEQAAAEIQSLRQFWECPDCGAANSGPRMVEACPACNSPNVHNRRYLQPAGFRVDWEASPHAETDRVIFIEPEPPRISVRGEAWEPLLDPTLGRSRASSEGLVFFASSGANKRNYRICLECGRAAEERADGSDPLVGHAPLRGRGQAGAASCPGNMRPFAIVRSIALGHEILTDVVEFQPAMLDTSGAGWALASALREALSRQLGIQPGELGMGVESRAGALGQRTHSVFLFDRNAGGAGFATRLLDDPARLLEAAEAILDCRVPGCERGCSSCVLTADLFAQQGTIDRQGALHTVRHLLSGMRDPDDRDIAVGGAVLSRPIADALARQAGNGDVVTIAAHEQFDLLALNEQPFLALFGGLGSRGTRVRLAMPSNVLSQLDAAQRLGLRDAMVRHRLELVSSDRFVAQNGAVLAAMLDCQGDTTGWFARDEASLGVGALWGVGQQSPIVRGKLAEVPGASVIDLDSLLARSTASVSEVEGPARPMRLFGDWFAKEIAQVVGKTGFWSPGMLESIHYSDRYLRSPLSTTLALRGMSALAKVLGDGHTAVPLTIETSPLDPNKTHMPRLVQHDWLRNDDRRAVVEQLATQLGLACRFAHAGAGHAREINLRYVDGRVARIYLDQGFGFWKSTGQDRFDFNATPSQQVRQLQALPTMVRGDGKTYFAALAMTTGS